MEGRLKVTFSLIEFSVCIDISNSSSNFWINSLTNISGTDAPEEIEITETSRSSFKSSEFASGIKTAFLAPNFNATSTSLLELEELFAPIIIKYSDFSASFFTAFCLFVVA